MQEVKQDDKNSDNQCSVCSSYNLIFDKGGGELVCQDCGNVVSESMFYQPFENKLSEGGRRGPFIDPSSVTPLTTIIKGSKDYWGKNVDMEATQSLRKWQKKIDNSKQRGRQRNLYAASSYMSNLQTKMGLPQNVFVRAVEMYKKYTIGFSKGRSIDLVSAVTLYAASREVERTSRSLNEFAHYSRLNKKSLSQTFREIFKEVQEKSPNIIPPQRIENFISRGVNHFKLNSEVQKIALTYLNRLKQLQGTGGKSPEGLAAAFLWLASKQAYGNHFKEKSEILPHREHKKKLNDWYDVLLLKKKLEQNGYKDLTQHEVSDFYIKTEVTLRNRAKEIVEKLRNEFPELVNIPKKFLK